MSRTACYFLAYAIVSLAVFAVLAIMRGGAGTAFEAVVADVIWAVQFPLALLFVTLAERSADRAAAAAEAAGRPPPPVSVEREGFLGAALRASLIAFAVAHAVEAVHVAGRIAVDLFLADACKIRPTPCPLLPVQPDIPDTLMATVGSGILQIVALVAFFAGLGWRLSWLVSRPLLGLAVAVVGFITLTAIEGLLVSWWGVFDLYNVFRGDAWVTFLIGKGSQLAIFLVAGLLGYAMSRWLVDPDLRLAADALARAGRIRHGPRASAMISRAFALTVPPEPRRPVGPRPPIYQRPGAVPGSAAPG